MNEHGTLIVVLAITLAVGLAIGVLILNGTFAKIRAAIIRKRRENAKRCIVCHEITKENEELGGCSCGQPYHQSCIRPLWLYLDCWCGRELLVTYKRKLPEGDFDNPFYGDRPGDIFTN